MRSTFKIWQLACLTRSADTRSGKRQLRRPLNQAQASGTYPRTGDPSSSKEWALSS